MFTTSTGKLRPIWAFVLSAILSAVAFMLSGNIAVEVVGERRFLFELVFRPVLCVLLLGIYIWLLTVSDHVEEHRVAAQGLPRVHGWFRQFVIGMVLGLVLTVIAVAPIHFWGHATTFFDHGMIVIPKIAVALVMMLFGSLAEELMFRGYPFQHLEQAIGPVAAIAVFSVIYGFLHLLNPAAGKWAVITSILIGVLLAIAYLRTRALWLPWGIHFGWNVTLGFVFGLPVSGFHYFNVLAHTTATGPKLITGGDYGVEAAIPGAVAVLLGILIVSLLPWTKLPQPEPESSSESSLHDVASPTHP